MLDMPFLIGIYNVTKNSFHPGMNKPPQRGSLST